ncbi:hypothetical protein POJ06DRAFT_246409 [Lipomyces tetrasporus]|uniref:PAS domain-containing protein n=1 Tax=Lipomyces tetrasporus TaxID=54092 RepID=A0AAD7QX92_9ASCO|nr:uncharacterized protein POJ06DRAFT_246409 [Lipomyces tetrasporus]KAJ8103050.1 hypothetical protein POJ06DRAFT_246409 [Lipomyces tetrasporus]
MDITFITIHDLTKAGIVLFASDSIELVLGYTASEVEGRSVFDYFHPDELPFAREAHGRGVSLDKAAVIAYCRLLSKDGAWIPCECVFTVVYDVLVAATTVYRHTVKGDVRARLAPFIRRAFSYSSIESERRAQMMNHLTPKFEDDSNIPHEPRAALILNRMSQSLPILYSTHAINDIVGLAPDEITGWNLWDCMDASSLESAQLSLERAKENDSISYLRFAWRDPRSQVGPSTLPTQLRSQLGARESTPTRFDIVEVEAVVSCTSDGLVMVLRRARPISTPEQAALVGTSHGVFASPWGAPVPILPLPVPTENISRQPSPFMVASPSTAETTEYVDQENQPSSDGDSDIFGSIRQMAVLTWAMNPQDQQQSRSNSVSLSSSSPHHEAAFAGYIATSKSRNSATCLTETKISISLAELWRATRRAPNFSPVYSNITRRAKAE